MSLTVSAEVTAPDSAEVVGIPVALGPQILGDANGLSLDELESRGFEGKVGETTTLDGLVAVGVGPEADVTPDVIRRASAALVKETWKRASIANALVEALPEDRAGAAQAAAEGTLLAAYRFGRYKKEAESSATKLENVVIVAKGGKRVRDAVERGAAIAEAVTLARDLVNTPAGDLTPPVFADLAVETAERSGITAEVIDDKQAAKLGLGGLLGVGKGSDNPPRMVKLTYEPPSGVRVRGHLALVGKGITFDSGGLSIKPGDSMMTMKIDMSGAAAVLGAMSVLPALAPAVRVTGYLCMAENMVSGRAIRPGDVLRINNGTTVEVLNTDAEGRLVLADGLSLAAGADPAPDAIIDLATLTGACVVALGPRIAGLMGNNDGLLEQVRSAADRAGEKVWPLPLPAEYRRDLDSEIADLKNIAGGRYGGALHAGLFLQEFVDGRPWVHVDIAGPARFESDDAYTPKGGSGFGVRTIIETVLAFKKPR